MASVVNISRLIYSFLGDMIFDVLLSRNLCREQLSLCPGVSRFFRGVVFYTLCLHRTRSLVVFSFLGCDFRSLVMWWQRLRAAGGTRLFYSWYHLVFVSFSCLLLGFRQEDIPLFCFQLFLSWTTFFFTVYCFFAVYALRRQRLHAVPIPGTHTLVDI